MADIKISEMTTAATLNGAEVSILSQSQGGQLVSVKATLQAIANWFAVNAEYTNALNTQDKRICGAINELKQLISLIPQFSIEVVQVLPTEDISDTTIYLVPAEDPEVGNYYEEYIHVNNTWELVGTTAVDLSAYYTKLEVDAKFSALATVATSGSYNDLTNKPDLSALMDVHETTFENSYIKKFVPSGQYTEKLKKLIGASVVWNQFVDTATTSVTIPSGHKYIHWNGSTLTKGTSDGTAISVTGGTDKISDLTFMFGSSVADGITVEQFAFLFPNYSETAYSANTIQSVSVSAKKNVGKNLFDEVYAGINRNLIYKSYSCPNGTYTMSSNLPFQNNATNLFFFAGKVDSGANTNVNGVYNGQSRTVTITDNYFTIAYRYDETYTANKYNPENYNTQVEIGSIATTYEPYTEITYPTDHTDLNGLFKLDANNNIYADGDEYTPDGSEKVKFEKRAYQAGDESLPDAITDGTNTVVKLTTPTSAALTPYEKLQAIEPGGTEEFVDYGVQSGTRDVAIPAGNETAYGDNELMGKVVNYMTT